MFCLTEWSISAISGRYLYLGRGQCFASDDCQAVRGGCWSCILDVSPADQAMRDRRQDAERAEGMTPMTLANCRFGKAFSHKCIILESLLVDDAASAKHI